MQFGFSLLAATEGLEAGLYALYAFMMFFFGRLFGKHFFKGDCHTPTLAMAWACQQSNPKAAEVARANG